jgi:outer membrane biosynthesis protein TonB
MSARLFSALSFSMAVHLALWSGLFGHAPQAIHRGPASLLENSVFIDPAAMEAVRQAKAKARAAAEAKAVRAAAVKKPEAPPVPPKPEPKPAAAAKPAVSAPKPPDSATAGPPAARVRTAEFAAAVAKMPERAVRVTPLGTPSGTAQKPAGIVTKTGADLMANPETRGLFADYFGTVKARIQQKLREKCAGREVGRGSVDLAFILLADGRLHKVYVMDRSSNADSQLKQLAIESLRESAPFVDFPSDFNARQIAFNLTVYFDEL